MLTKDPLITKNRYTPKKYFKTGRDAFKAILSELKFCEEKKLLLPGYIGITDREGSGVFDPVIETKTPYDFYILDQLLRAKKQELYNQISSGKYRAILIIHYFGFCQNDMIEISRLCKVHSVILIEDCAHSMLSFDQGKELGKIGDFCIYSLHKFLPTESGGCLRINNEQFLYLLEKPDQNKPTIDALDIMLKADLEAIREKRRVNYLKLLSLIKDINGIEIMWPELPTGITPHDFPILIKNGQRETIYFKLIKCDIPVIALYYRMIAPITSLGFEDAHYVSENILNLPVHQDIEIEDLITISDELKKALLR